MLRRLSTVTHRVDEIFGPTIQGEGPVAGRVTAFVRFGGCDFRCAWCDTLHAVLPEFKRNWTPMRPEHIVDQVDQILGFAPGLVTLSGGNPALHKLADLIGQLHERGHEVCLETQATASPDWLADVDHLVLSPKGPSSGMAPDLDGLDRCVGLNPQRAALKVVIFDDADFAFAREVATRHPALPMYAQPGTPGRDDTALRANTAWLMEKVAKTPECRHWRVIPQLHVVAWGGARGM